MALTPEQISASNQQFANWYAQPTQQTSMPAYLQGTQTGAGLFGQSSGLQSSIPSIGGQNNYIPGQGMVPYAAPASTTYSGNNFNGTSGWISANQYAPGDGTVEYVRTGGTPKSLASSIPPINSGGTLSGGSSSPSGGLSILPYTPVPDTSGGTTTGGGTTSGGTSSTGGWLSPDELRARTQSLQGIASAKPAGSGNNSGQGGGGGSNSGTASGSGGGSLGGLLGGNTSSGTPNISAGSMTFPQTPTVTYAQPSQPANMGGTPANGLQMQQASPQSALNDYYNTPGYQLLMNNQQQQFQQSPGYQFAVNQALGQVQSNASARGLLESGSVLKEMTDRAQGMASQEYNNWWNRQNQAFSDYQNRLAGLAGGNVGGDQAYNLGQSMAQNTANTGNNLSSLFGNQGTAGYGGLVNTGAAQAGNINNAGSQQAQINSANASTQLAGAVYNRGLF